MFLQLKERDSKLEEAGDLHRFLRDLDHFQAWLTKTQTDVASEDIPGSLADAERLLNQHQAIREEIENYTDDYTKMMEYGESITAVSIEPFYKLNKQLIPLQFHYIYGFILIDLSIILITIGFMKVILIDKSSFIP